MAIKIIHTADWHLGHQLHNFERTTEHRAFFTWLLELIKKEQANALIVAGDIFDSANPSAAAWEMLHEFLAACVKAMPSLKIILLGGNHDSPSKLNAPHSLLKLYDLHMLGSVQRDANGELELNSLLVPIYGQEQKIEAWVMALPFLRISDLRLPQMEDSQDRVVAAVKRVYDEVLQEAQNRQEPGQALIATGHLYMASSTISELSERRILGGNQHALSATIFNDHIDYVALGHMHKAQIVAKQNRIRYSGSPIPFSFNEKNYQHQVLVVNFEKGSLSQIESHFVPRAVDLIRMPEKALPIKETLDLLEKWQPKHNELALQPLVEVPVLLSAPEPMLKEKILQALDGKAVRLAKISPEYKNQKKEQDIAVKSLEEVTPMQVFTHHWQEKFATAPCSQMLDIFTRLQTELEQEGE